MKPIWVYPQTTPYFVQGRDLSEDNFAQEDRSNLVILIREALQNPLDARAPDNVGPVRIRISMLQSEAYDAAYLEELLPTEYCERLVASGGDALPDVSARSVLVIEDFGTTGLQGTWQDQNADGPSENWNAFWFREGEGAKATVGSNGRAGQGKITYYRIGAARAVFGLTVRASDGKTLLMGRSAFRRAYPYKGAKYLRHSFWCNSEHSPLPTTDDAEIDRFRKAFALARAHEPGLSLVIPIPTEFIPKEAIRTIISEFYYPVACGNLEVSIGGLEIAAANIDAIAQQVLPDELVRERKSAFTKGFRTLVKAVIADEKQGVSPVQLKPGWDKSSALSDAALPEGALANLREAAENGSRISVRCPVAVRPKKGDVVLSWFDVHIEIPEDLDRVEEAYIRRDLLIGAEDHLTGAAYLQKARALTLVRDGPLSAFLADAEEPTHLRWNGSRPRLTEDYANPQGTLRAVRNAAPRLLMLLSNGIVKRDTKTLARYFTRPTPEGKKHTAAGAATTGGKTVVTTTPPVPARKPFRIATGTDRVRVLPNGSAAPTSSDLPISCTLEVAYEGLDQNPFKAYDPFDFDLADMKVHAISVSGAKITEQQGNRVTFEVLEPDFSVEVPGFDRNIRLRARLNYTEKNNGADVSEE